jgi:hypothetical protein
MLTLLLAPRLVLVLRGFCVADVILFLPLGAAILEPDLHLKQPNEQVMKTEVVRNANTETAGFLSCDIVKSQAEGTSRKLATATQPQFP